jgi:hypothetical protein
MQNPAMPGDFSTIREPAVSEEGDEVVVDMGDAEIHSNDPQALMELLAKERRRRTESELKRKEAEDEKYELEKAQRAQENPYVPVAITPDLLARTISESMRQVSKGGPHHRYHIRMPTPGCTGAPETFTGASGKLLPEFFRRFELSLAEAEISEEGEMLNHLLKYVSVTVKEWIQNQPSFQRGRYDDLKSALLALYDNPERGDPYTIKDLSVLAMEYSKTEVTHPDALSERLMVFDTMASKLMASKRLNEVDRDQLYFKTFTPARREVIWEHLIKTEPWHPRKEPFPMLKVCKAAKYLIEGRFDEEIEGDPRPSGQRLLDEVKRMKEAETNHPEPKGGDLYEVIKKMKNLSLQDPVYEAHYAYIVEKFPEAARMVKKPETSPPPRNTYTMQNMQSAQGSQWRNSEWPRNKCFYCGTEGCGMSTCPLLTKDISEGVVIKDGLNLLYKTRERLYRKANGIREDVLGRLARESAERTSANHSAKGPASHQVNAYQIVDEERYDGYYIGIQECEPNDVEKVNVYTQTAEEERLADIAETYFLELAEDGWTDDEAVEVAWSMANLRSGNGTKGREARESAKPYDREKGRAWNEKGKGKAKGVRFADPSIANTPMAPKMDIDPVVPAPRFPPAAPMPSQPVPLPKPAASDWPRATQANPVVSPSQAASSKAAPAAKPANPFAPLPKPVSTPEIDMTTKEPGPKYRFTSDVEESVNVDKTIERIFGEVKLTVGLSELLALSPAMRKRLAEMTKTKRVPTTDFVPKSKKVTVAEEVPPEDEVYVSTNMVQVERNPKYSAALPRVQTEMSGVLGVGMMDTGSQINIMTEEFWMKTSLPINEGRKIRMQGVNLIGDQSLGLCEGVEVPFGSVMTRAHFHVFKKAPYDFILGQPWIQDHLLAVTETGHVNKILIRDFRDPRNRVTIVLRNDPENVSRGDMPTVLELSMPPIEVASYAGLLDGCTVDENVFDELEESLARADEREISRIDAMTGKKEERAPSFRRQL